MLSICCLKNSLKNMKVILHLLLIMMLQIAPKNIDVHFKAALDTSKTTADANGNTT